MINAAHIMTPNTRVTPTSPSLQTLQSPVKPFLLDAKTRVERDQEVVLAEGNNVLVVKQGGDLIVTETLQNDDDGNTSSPTKREEDIDDDQLLRRASDLFQPSPAPSLPATSSEHDELDEDAEVLPPSQQPAPSRSRSNSRSRFSLHKAVLVRNSQRVLIDQEDEEDVTRLVSPEREHAPGEDDEYEESLNDEVAALEEAQTNDDDTPEEIEAEEEGHSASGSEHDEGEPENPRRSLSLRASIGAIGQALVAPFAARWSAGGVKDGDQEEGVEEDGVSVEEAHAPNPDDESFEDEASHLDQKHTDVEDAAEDDELHEGDSSELPKPPLQVQEEVSSNVPITPSPPKIEIPPPLFSSGLAPLSRPFFTPQPQRTFNAPRASLGTHLQAPDSTAKSRRNRFSNFGLPDYVANTTIADNDEEVEQALNVVPAQAVVCSLSFCYFLPIQMDLAPLGSAWPIYSPS